MHRILWPFGADQPILVKQVKHNLKVGFELDQVKTALGPGKPVHDTGVEPAGTREAVGKEFREVIGKARGEEGKAMRGRAEVIKKALSEAWAEGGGSKKDLKALVNKYT